MPTREARRYQSFLRWTLRGSFALAGCGLGLRLILGSTIAEALIAIALLLFLPDCLRMAIVDLEKFWCVRQSYPAPLVNPFLYPVLVAIGSELLGFYLAWVTLGWGMVAILAGQLWFNLVVPITLIPHSRPQIQIWPLGDRLVVVFADAIALLLACHWTLSPSLWGASVLLGIILVYLVIKYGPLLMDTDPLE